MGKRNGKERPAKYGNLGPFVKLPEPHVLLGDPDLDGDDFRFIIVVAWHADGDGRWSIGELQLRKELGAGPDAVWGYNRFARVRDRLMAKGIIGMRPGTKTYGRSGPPSTEWTLKWAGQYCPANRHEAGAVLPRSDARSRGNPAHRTDPNRPKLTRRTEPLEPQHPGQGTRAEARSKARSTAMRPDDLGVRAAYAWLGEQPLTLVRELQRIRGIAAGDQRASAIDVLAERVGLSVEDVRYARVLAALPTEGRDAV